MLYTDLKVELPKIYLGKVEKLTMANSIEARVPFLDNDLESFASTLPVKFKVKKGKKKYLLRHALINIVPDELLEAKKRGVMCPGRFG